MATSISELWARVEELRFAGGEPFEKALKEAQDAEDKRALAHLADRIGVPVDELENFIEIIKKRIAE
jgi:hypothetical protein